MAASDPLVLVDRDEGNAERRIDLEEFEDGAVDGVGASNEVVENRHVDLFARKACKEPLDLRRERHDLAIGEDRLEPEHALGVEHRGQPSALAAVGLGLEGGGELGDVFEALIDDLGVMRGQNVDGVTYQNQDLRFGIEGVDLLGRRM